MGTSKERLGGARRRCRRGCCMEEMAVCKNGGDGSEEDDLYRNWGKDLGYLYPCVDTCPDRTQDKTYKKKKTNPVYLRIY